MLKPFFNLKVIAKVLHYEKMFHFRHPCEGRDPFFGTFAISSLNKKFLALLTHNTPTLPKAGISTIIVFFLGAAICAQIKLEEKVDIAKVWAGHPVNFAIKTKNKFQCIAYYDTTRKMIIASRTPGSATWSYTTLRTTPTGWDSHNYIDMAIDDSGYVHVSGDMHNVKLIYFRSKKPWSIEQFEQPTMIGSLETSVTYPVFIEGPQKKLLFQYRIGGSGDGVTIWNGYDLATKKWKRITDQGLFSNEGSVNAYSTSPTFGPDSCFHIVWMWRNSPVANTNHDLSHIKSNDLINWKNMAGKAVSIPVSQSNKDVVVDPISSGNGLINMDFWISWDRQNRAVITYHRYNNNNISQIFNTRWENNSWKIYQTSNWTSFKWNLDLEGSLTHDIAATPLSVDENGKLVQDYVYPKQELHRWILNETDLKPTSDNEYVPPESMKELYNLESKFQGMQVNTIHDGEYYIKWETMPINQDKERAAGTYPSSSMLRLYKFTRPTVIASGKTKRTTPVFQKVITSSGITINYSDPTMQKSGATTVQLITLSGETVVKKQFGYQNCFVPIDGIRAGVYVLKVGTAVKLVSVQSSSKRAP